VKKLSQGLLQERSRINLLQLNQTRPSNSNNQCMNERDFDQFFNLNEMDNFNQIDVPKDCTDFQSKLHDLISNSDNNESV
jgi:hypothetical protein